MPGETYHLFNRAVGNEKLFLRNENYEYFLNKYDHHMCQISKTYCYCILPNHFHFLIQIKSYQNLLSILKKTNPSFREKNDWQSKFVMQQFSNMLNGYAKKYNKKNERRGALFMDYMRRVEVKTEAQFTSTIFYIHKNAVHHGYCKEIPDWYWSSYNTILAEAPTKIERQKVLDWFGNLEKFIEYHSQTIYLKNTLEVE